MTQLHTITITEDEVQALREAVSPMSPSGFSLVLRGLVDRLDDDECRLSDGGRALLLQAAAALPPGAYPRDEGAVLQTPAWHIDVRRDGLEWAGWASFGCDDYHNVTGGSPAAVLDELLALWGSPDAKEVTP